MMPFAEALEEAGVEFRELRFRPYSTRELCCDIQLHVIAWYLASLEKV
jgi:hypothetical protein